MKAQISIVYKNKNIIAIRDLDAGAMSITNDAEGVTAFLISRGELNPETHLIYRDTEGNWDELVHDGAKFTGFKALATNKLFVAISKALSIKVEYVVSITEHQHGGAPLQILYAGPDYQLAFDTAVGARGRMEWKGKWIKFKSDSNIKWAQIL